MKILFSFTVVIHLLLLQSQAQNVAISTIDSVAHPSAGLDVNFPNKGVLIPRVSLMSIVDTISIPSPANSLMVYNTNPNIANGNGVGFYFYCQAGCNTKGWKFINFSENGTSSGSEWKFHSKLTFTNRVDDLDFTSLPAHDKWKVVIDVSNSIVGLNLNLQMILNGITFSNYGTRFEVGSSWAPVYGQSWILASGLETRVVNGEIVITGKPTTNQNIKTFNASLSCNCLYNFNLARFGFLNNDPNNVHRITIKTNQDPINGRIELWYKDNQ